VRQCKKSTTIHATNGKRMTNTLLSRRITGTATTATYHFIGPKGPIPRLIIERINIKLSSFPNPCRLLCIATATTTTAHVVGTGGSIIVIQCFCRGMIAFQTPTVRLKAIVHGKLDGAVTVTIQFVVVSGSSTVVVWVLRMMTVRVGTCLTL
jgi:hypothetical protein